MPFRNEDGSVTDEFIDLWNAGEICTEGDPNPDLWAEQARQAYEDQKAEDARRSEEGRQRWLRSIGGLDQ